MNKGNLTSNGVRKPQWGPLMHELLQPLANSSRKNLISHFPIGRKDTLRTLSGWRNIFSLPVNNSLANETLSHLATRRGGHPELSFSSSELSFQTAPPNSCFSMKGTFFFFVLWTWQWLIIACLSQTVIPLLSLNKPVFPVRWLFCFLRSSG